MELMMMRRMRFALTTAALTTTCLLAAGCQRQAATVTWQTNGIPRHDHPDQDWWRYQFVYHPDAQVYFEPYTGVYHWYAYGAWHRGTELPGYVAIDTRLATVAKLQTDRPYMQHQTVAQIHPPPAPRARHYDPLQHPNQRIMLVTHDE
jgi:hypothetical protein